MESEKASNQNKVPLNETRDDPEIPESEEFDLLKLRQVKKPNT